MRDQARFSLQPSERRLLLAAVDTLVVLIATLLGLSRWASWDQVDFIDVVVDRAGWLTLVPVWLSCLVVVRAYDLRVAAGVQRANRAVIAAAGTFMVLYLVAYFVAPPESLARSFILVQVVAAVLLLLVWRTSYARFFGRPRFMRRLLIVGSGSAAAELGGALKVSGGGTYEVVGVVSVGRDDTVHDFPHLGPAEEMNQTAYRHQAAEAVIALDGPPGPVVVREVLRLHEMGVQVTSMSSLFEALTGRVPILHLGSDWQLTNRQINTFYSVAKRLMDVVTALIGLSLFGLLFPVIVVGIKLDSRGPVFYTQNRLGWKGRPFRLVKLRTMIDEAEADGRAVWATATDPRVTRMGKILRSTMLDEMPQLWNVLKGEMSIVGPRPERPELVKDLEGSIPYYRVRHAVRPGMAGWALLHRGYSGSMEEALMKIQYDLFYIKHQSLWLDLRIILRTLGRGLTFRRSEGKLPVVDPRSHRD